MVPGVALGNSQRIRGTATNEVFAIEKYEVPRTRTRAAANKGSSHRPSACARRPLTPQLLRLGAGQVYLKERYSNSRGIIGRTSRCLQFDGYCAALIVFELPLTEAAKLFGNLGPCFPATSLCAFDYKLCYPRNVVFFYK